MPIDPARGPLYSSRMVNSVPPELFAVSVYVRTPLNRPSGVPPVNSRLPGPANLVTVTGNVRPGATFDWILSFLPSAIVPLMDATPESQFGHWAPQFPRSCPADRCRGPPLRCTL